MKLYRGVRRERGDQIVKSGETDDTLSNGEFGKGSYYWAHDLAAGVLSAVQYHGTDEDGWAVLEVEVEDDGLKSMMKQGGLVNFRSSGREENYDKVTQTAPRDITMPNKSEPERIDFKKFREINANPDKFGLTGVKNQVSWEKHNVIAGPSVAAPSDPILLQVKFANEDGLKILNKGRKSIVMSGQKLNANQFTVVQNWKLKDRKALFQKYFIGKKDNVILPF